MAELTGVPGFAPPRRENTTSRRRAAAIELMAMLGLTVSLAIAVTAVSLGNRTLTRGEFIERGGGPTPTGILVDETDQWLLINARFSVRAQ
jgi:hypothetical protein